MSTEQVGVEATAPPADEHGDRLHGLRRRMESLLGVPATEGNRLDVLRNGDEIFPTMLDEIERATSTVDLLTFVYWQGDIAHRFARALADRAEAGVRVRVLLDAIGGRLIDRELIDHMLDAGVLVEWFRRPTRVSPFKQNHRTHRKVLVCDERVAFTGGVGIAEEWEGDARDHTEWRDTHLRVEGPAVDGLAAAFAQNWAETGQPLADEHDRFPDHRAAGSSVVQVVRGSATVGWNDISTVFRVMLETARERLRLTTAYFAPDETMETLLCAAAGRGVAVDVLLPGPYADKRVCQVASESTYARLVDGGVRIWTFQPAMLHAKIATVDGLVSVVGSANFNSRSMHHDDEVVLTVFDPVVTRVLDGHFEDDLQRSEAISARRWAERSLPQKAAELGATSIRRWL